VKIATFNISNVNKRPPNLLARFEAERVTETGQGRPAEDGWRRGN